MINKNGDTNEQYKQTKKQNKETKQRSKQIPKNTKKQNKWIDEIIDISRSD